LNVRVILSSLVFIFAYNAILFYIGWNGWVWLDTVWPQWIELNLFVYNLVIIFLGYSYLFARFLEKVSFLKIIGACWFALIQYALLLLPVANLIVYVLKSAGVESELAVFYTGITTIVLFIFIFTLGLRNAYSPIVRTYKISISKHVETRSKLKIAVASDMHFGTLSGKGHLSRMIKLIKEINPDLILLPGDIIDDNPRPFVEKKMDQMMKDLTAPLGVFGVLGNHEYYGGQIREFTKIMKDIEINILQDEVILIENQLYLVGRKDKTDKKRQSIKQLVQSLDRNKPIFLIDHQPTALQEAMENKIDLSVSGHTHRGQMAPNHLITKRIFELDWGYKQKEQLHAFVSSGYGFWGPPIRIGSRSEILQIEVEFKKS